MSTDCTNCLGHGLVGAGPEPWLRQGAVVTCPECGGTGKVGPADEVVAPEVSEPAPEVAPAQDAPVDNSNLTEAPSDDASIPSDVGGEVSEPQIVEPVITDDTPLE